MSNKLYPLKTIDDILYRVLNNLHFSVNCSKPYTIYHITMPVKVQVRDDIHKEIDYFRQARYYRIKFKLILIMKMMISLMKIVEMMGGIQEVRFDESLTLLTFDI